jgi:hypothetical protein
MRCTVWFVSLSLSIGILGCGSGRETDEERLKRLVPSAVPTTPVKGKVTVNGEPVEGLWVRLLPASGETPTFPSQAQTNSNGEFEIGTYKVGDGAPKGEYNITIEWLVYYQKTWNGPDGLGEKYNDPKTSKFTVTVDNKPVVLPPMELTVDKSVADIKAQFADPSNRRKLTKEEVRKNKKK